MENPDYLMILHKNLIDKNIYIPKNNCEYYLNFIGQIIINKDEFYNIEKYYNNLIKKYKGLILKDNGWIYYYIFIVLLNDFNNNIDEQLYIKIINLFNENFIKANYNLIFNN